MKLYGLIGFPLTHSFSKKYFTEKFEKEGIQDSRYELFEIDSIQKITEVIKQNESELIGLNVTIPYKEQVIPFLDELDDAAKIIGAVNVVKLIDGKLVGYNSDYYGFKHSLENFIGTNKPNALILGTGGASKAVAKALNDLDIKFKYVSRKSREGVLDYNEAKVAFAHYRLIINTSPLGMYPEIETCPDLPYEDMDGTYYLYDLVYNPLETLFLKKGRYRGAKTMSGMEMLVGQAEKAYEIWTKK